MSTSLNDVVCEVYTDIFRQIDMVNRKPNILIRILRRLEREYRAWDKKRRWIHAGGSPEPFKAMSVYELGMNIFVPTSKIFPDAKIAVYSVITGGYDNYKPPIYFDDTIDYYLVTDADIDMRQYGPNFFALPLPEKIKGLPGSKKNRYLKLHPEEVLSGKNYDYSVYIDGSLRITCDIKPLVYSLIDSGKSIAVHRHCIRDCIYEEAQGLHFAGRAELHALLEQINAYKSEGMPAHFGLLENTVLIRKCNDPELQRIMHEWWLQIERYTHRDQLSLPYVLWKNGYNLDYAFSLGNNVWRNPYFLYSPHEYVAKS